MPAAKKTSAKGGSAKGHVLQPVTISIILGEGRTPPTVDPPVAVVRDNQRIHWIPSGKVDWWVVKIEPNHSVDDGHRGYVFSNSPGKDTTAPLHYNRPDIIKYSVATPSGVFDPHIIPMP
ncbi:MAG TPA: hypothetical protein VKM93_22355 [Terriglobia bacterium]|nr:hypothetical protein [Terriglobia bacterium]